MNSFKSSVEDLLNNDELIRIEEEIAKKMNCIIYRENLQMLQGFISDEIDSSMLDINRIKEFIVKSGNKVVEFATKFLSDSQPQKLSTGIAITYAIYLIYLNEKSDDELHLYIKRRRIPQPKKLLAKLRQIKSQI